MFSFWWLIYRKMYIPALVVFLLNCIPIVGPLAVCVGLGIGGNFLYYKHLNKQLQKVSAITDTNARNSALVQLGGVNKWVTNVAIGVMILAAIIGFLAAIRH